MAEEWKLIIRDPQGRSKKMKLSAGGSYKLGTGKDCKIRLPASYKGLMDTHLQLELADNTVQVQAIAGAPLTVNGEAVPHAELSGGEDLTAGALGLQFQRAEGAVKAAPKAATPSLDPNFIGSVKDELKGITSATNSLMEQVGKRIVGQEHIIRAIWASILAKGHCLLIGVPGLAKTYTVMAFSEILGMQFNRIQFTPDLMPSDIVGSTIVEEDTDGKRQFKFIEGPVFTQLLLADEINRTPPKTQAALLEAMQEKQVTVGDRTMPLPKPFTVIAAQNPIDQEGTYPLPEAQQDRFMMCLVLDYPERDQEVDIAIRTTQGKEPEVDQVLTPEMILRFQMVVDRIAVSKEAAEYAVDLVRSTRTGEKGVPDYVSDLVDFGAGPRAVQSLLKAAKAYAAMDGRPAVAKADIRDLALPVLRHRIRCNYRARAEKMDEDRVIQRLVKEMGR